MARVLLVSVEDLAAGQGAGGRAGLQGARHAGYASAWQVTFTGARQRQQAQRKQVKQACMHAWGAPAPGSPYWGPPPACSSSQRRSSTTALQRSKNGGLLNQGPATNGPLATSLRCIRALGIRLACLRLWA